jgi:hypothetical protein
MIPSFAHPTRLRAITRFIAFQALAIVVSAETGTRLEESRSFEGVTAAFEVKTPVVKLGEDLKVTVVYSNDSAYNVRFRFFPVQEDAELYRKGDREAIIGGFSGEPHFDEVILKPGEKFQVDDSILMRAWHDLVPGNYEIRFCYHLGLFEDEMLRKKYQSIYPHDQYVVPWNDRKYQFTLVK